MLQSILEFLIQGISTSESSYVFHKALSFFKPVSSLIKDVYKFIFHDTMNRNIDKTLYIIGIFYLLKLSYGAVRHLKWISAHALGFVKFNPSAFRKRYGINSYVLVTGFTEGIGLAFACEFAKLQFNLVLVGRNQVKIQNALKVIKRQNSKIDIKVIEVDFSAQDYVIKNKIQEDTKELDISIIVNNVGFATRGIYFQQKPSDILKVIKTNINSMVIMNRLFVPRFKFRKNQSGIINLSSCTGVYPSPFTGIYPATKVYIDVMSRIITEEAKQHGVDILTYRPFGVSTPMMSQKRGPMMITPKQCAETAIHQLGILGTSYGGYKHKLSGQIFAAMTQQKRLIAYDKFKM